MKKKKEKYSLTANQRKIKRQPEKQKEPEKSFDELTEDEKAAIIAEKEAKKQKSKKINRLIAIILASVLALGSVATGIVLLVLSSKIDNDKVNPVATINLSNNQKVDIELFYTDENLRATVANFIYLAKNNFYNDTVFLANKDKTYLLMSGTMMDAEANTPTRHKSSAQNSSYLMALKGFTKHTVYTSGNTDFKLGYRLTRAGDTPSAQNEMGYAAFLAGNTDARYASSTSFLLLGRNNNNFNTATNKFDLTYFGKMDESSVQKVQNMLSAGFASETKHGITWLFTQTDPVTIKSITISKLNKKLEKNILNNFEEFVLDTESTFKGALKGQASKTWRNKTDSYFGVVS